MTIVCSACFFFRALLLFVGKLLQERFVFLRSLAALRISVFRLLFFGKELVVRENGGARRTLRVRCAHITRRTVARVGRAKVAEIAEAVERVEVVEREAIVAHCTRCAVARRAVFMGHALAATAARAAVSAGASHAVAAPAVFAAYTATAIGEAVFAGGMHGSASAFAADIVKAAKRAAALRWIRIVRKGCRRHAIRLVSEIGFLAALLAPAVKMSRLT